MNFQRSTFIRAAFIGLIAAVSPLALAAQVTTGTPTLIIQRDRPVLPVAAGANLYCAGFIQTSAISTANKLIAGQDEADKFNYAQNDFLYINMGADKGVNVGDVFSIVRPRGTVKNTWSKKGDLGFYVQEVGAVEVLKVKGNMSAVRVKHSCDTFLLGDLVQLRETRQSPLASIQPKMDVFGDRSGRATGRIIMARDSAEMLAKDFVAYVDLGADNNVQVGDRLTVFRPLTKGNITTNPKRESVSSRDYGFESEVYKGGRFSNQSARKTGDHATGREVTTKMVRDDRPDDMRKVVGEAVVLNVKEKTATIVITRTAQEIHTGDWVEIQ